LLPLALRVRPMLDYARARHIAQSLLADLMDPPAAAAHPDEAGRAPDAAPDMLPMVRAFAFGAGSVMVGDRQVTDLEWRSEKSKEMLFFLLAKKLAVPKEAIFAALWPDLPESKCNSNFHSSLYRLRRALFHECVIRDADGAYALNPKGVFVTDVDSFNRAMLEADVAKDDETRRAKLEEAIGSHKGSFLSSTYSEWTDPIRQELEDRYVEALNELAALRLRGGAFQDALALFRALETADTYSEAAAYGIMRCHVALNDGASAARHFRRFRQLLKDELDEEPSPRLVDLYRDASGRQ
jgi:two-component SAPR family response regulator